MNVFAVAGIGLIVGVLAFCAYSCCVAAGDADKAMEEMTELRRKEILKNKKS